MTQLYTEIMITFYLALIQVIYGWNGQCLLLAALAQQSR